MNVRRFVGKNAREAIAQARAAFGDQAVVLSNRPIAQGVEILAMAGNDVPLHGSDVEVPPRAVIARTAAAAASVAASAAAAPTAPRAQAAKAAPAQPREQDEPMSTLSFQQFVRERQLREQQLREQQPARPGQPPSGPAPTPPVEPGRFAAQALHEATAGAAQAAGRPAAAPAARGAQAMQPAAPDAPGEDLMNELKSMRGMIATQLASMSWFDSVRRNPAQTQLLRLMIDNGFSPALARSLVGKLPAGLDDSRAEWWLLEALARNLRCTAAAQSVAQQGGTFALIGPTGVGKTTTTAKIAAQFALQHGAASVGLITVDTYRMGASDQLRAYGKLLNIPVHTARDAASLADLLGLFDRKKLVLIDTVGVGARDKRLSDVMESLPASVARLLVLNAAAQAEALEETVQAFGTGPGMRCVISKLDEAVKCGAVVDVAVRHQLVVEGVANGQRVPEDWHAPRAQLLVQKALMRQPASVFTPDDSELGLLFTAPPAAAAGAQGGAPRQGAARA